MGDHCPVAASSRIGIAAGSVSIIAALLVLFRQQLQEAVSANTLINVLGVAAVLTGSLRLLGAFEVERRTGRETPSGDPETPPPPPTPL
jgi:uncharacterized membrane protein HdeD (DUF308 family)